MIAGARAPFEAFFLPARRGERFCVFHPAAGASLGSIVYLHPFAEEMNKSRRMAALQSRAFAAQGYAVLQIDLFGCGESAGEFGEGRWELWKEDAALAVDWLRKHAEGPVHLWGLRLGALLALDHARESAQQLAGLLMWQPVISGEQFLTQFLRLRVASEMLSSGAASSGTEHLRSELDAGRPVEVAGYELAPELARSIDGLRLVDLAPPAMPARWLEVVPEPGRVLAPASRRVLEYWKALDVDVEARTAVGEPFWNSVEITECPELVHETMNAMALAEA
jgi:exosortase A-associated hydrolase 2